MRLAKMNRLTTGIEEHWAYIKPILSIRNEEEYDQAIERLNSLLDKIGTDESHPLYELLDTLGMVIYAYEAKHYPIPDASHR
jgi:HTH-type transcriptional regulator / antitoxin HigA